MTTQRQTGHTPGPWAINEWCDCVHKADPNDSYIIAERPHGGIGKDFFEANAALIAAAPELLEVCRKWVNTYDSSRNISEKHDLARETAAIIRKAMGRADG